MLHDGDSDHQHEMILQPPEPMEGNEIDFMHSCSINGEDANGGGSTTDRSSISPSHVDEMNDLIENGVKYNAEGKVGGAMSENDRRIELLDAKFIYIQHQMSKIMRHLHVTPCVCESCNEIHQNIEGVRQLNDPTDMLSQLFPNASPQQLRTLLDLSKMNKLPSQVVSQKEHMASAPVVAKPKLGADYSAHNGGGKIGSVTGIEASKKAIADYARIHGGAAAAKKFGIPPPVSTYYQKKDSSSSLLANTPLVSLPTNGMNQLSNSATASPGPSSDGGDRDEMAFNHEPALVANNQNAAIKRPSAPAAFPQKMVDMIMMNTQNAAHSTGSPGFLRGRGRGRPKLIGDELDADLVDYMVQVKQSDPHGHMTASQALVIARQYILERAPGLLEEHGGHVKLKLTWAMKLVSRIAERQKEIELGLPAGTLSNMGRNLNSLPGGNLMADMMAQNILSQHMLMVNQMNNGEPTNTTTIEEKPPKIEKHQNEENLATVQPEIVNIKELHLPFLNNFLAELNGKAATVVDGEIAGDIATN
ncbi:unnamed protein product [Caenorhabditis bovis]|uniref:Uncharacterized protein n=1 Tax=Caenorhabditis bovis TaxID=2654633 RepID=A0A8S1ETW6_9PELO|nr:unnamed protein product [Caenorhabditis bovis]